MEKTEKREPTYEIKELDKSPCALLHNCDDDTWDVICGNFKLGQEMYDKEVVERRIMSIDWDLITMVIAAMINNIIK